MGLLPNGEVATFPAAERRKSLATAARPWLSSYAAPRLHKTCEGRVLKMRAYHAIFSDDKMSGFFRKYAFHWQSWQFRVLPIRLRPSQVMNLQAFSARQAAC